MKRIKLVGILLVVMSAIGIMITSSASARVFLFIGTGTLLGKALATQKFVTHAGTVECTALTLTGTVPSLKTLKQKVTVSYTGCKAFGLAATVSPAEYEFNADGTVAVLKAITIKATACLVTVPSGQTVGVIKYLNKPVGHVEIEPEVTGITSSGVGAACEYAVESNGTYTGNSDLHWVGQVIVDD
jgi:hypothetical protein